MIVTVFLDKDLEMPLFVEDAVDGVDGVPANLVKREATKILDAELREFISFILSVFTAF